MAFVIYPKHDEIFQRETTQPDWRQILISRQPDTILYFGSGSELNALSASMMPFTSSWAVDVVNGTPPTFADKIPGTFAVWSSATAISNTSPLYTDGTEITTSVGIEAKGGVTSSLLGTSSWAVNVVNAASFAGKTDYNVPTWVGNILSGTSSLFSNAVLTRVNPEFEVVGKSEFTGSVFATQLISGSSVSASNITAPNITGSLLGTSSWALNVSNTGKTDYNVPVWVGNILSGTSSLNANAVLTRVNPKLEVTGSVFASQLISGLTITGSAVNASKTMSAPDISVTNVTASSYSVALNAITTVAGAAYTLTNSDDGEILSFTSAAPVAVTVPATLENCFNCSVYQSGSGQLTFAGSGVITIRNRSGHTKTAGQFAMVTLVRINTSNDVVLCGDTAA